MRGNELKSALQQLLVTNIITMNVIEAGDGAEVRYE
jgi:hypothetical protein